MLASSRANRRVIASHATRIFLNHFSRQENYFWRLIAPFWLLLIGSGLLDHMSMMWHVSPPRIVKHFLLWLKATSLMVSAMGILTLLVATSKCFSAREVVRLFLHLCVASAIVSLWCVIVMGNLRCAWGVPCPFWSLVWHPQTKVKPTRRKDPLFLRREAK